MTLYLRFCFIRAHFAIVAVNEELDLILHQETLPADVVTSLGMDVNNMKVLTPAQLIEVNTSYLYFVCQIHPFLFPSTQEDVLWSLYKVTS